MASETLTVETGRPPCEVRTRKNKTVDSVVGRREIVDRPSAFVRHRDGTGAVGATLAAARIARSASRQRHPAIRARYAIALGAAVAAVAVLAHAGFAQAGSPRPVYFFSDNSQPIGPHNRLVKRPSGFVLFLDGQWVLQGLHWTGWGSAVARATGVSNSSSDVPDAARGRRIKTWADMTLSSPVRWHGHEVYSCFKILVPPPASDLSGCVLPNLPIGSGWLAGGTGEVEFLAPGKRIWCGLDTTLSFCAGHANRQPLAAVPALGATISPSGTVTLCSVPATPNLQAGCAQDWDATAPVLSVGQAVKAANVLCRSERAGIVCKIASGIHKGTGFQINGSTVRRLP